MLGRRAIQLFHCFSRNRRKCMNEQKLRWINFMNYTVHGQFIHTNSVVNIHKDRVTVTFERSSGEEIKIEGKEGDTLLDIVVNNDIDLDGFGACEGTLCCSTCHVILKQEDFDRLPDQPTDEELDMLDLAYGLTDTSRLGCQICISKELNGLEVTVPEGVSDARG